MNNKGILKYQIISNFDWVIFGLTIIISVVGIFTIYSTGGSGGEPGRIYIKQIYWILYGLMAMLLILFIDYHSLEKLAYILYFVIIMVAVSGKTVSGARRWLSFAQFTFQPSELAKIVIIITLARYFDDKKIRGLYRIRDLITPAIVVLIPAVLIAKQPDLGTAVVIFFIFISMSFLIGINIRSLFILAGSAIVSLPFLWHFMKDYQKNRILTLINPQADPLGSGYHIIQSKIARFR